MRSKKFKILFWGSGNRAKTILSMINYSQGCFEYKNKKILNYEISIVNLDKHKYYNNFLNKKNYKIIEDQKSLKSNLLSSNSFIVAVGGTSGNFRFSLSKRLIKDYKLKPISFCSKDYVKDKSINFGEGYQIMKNVTINSNVKIGDYCVLNTSSTIDHDCKINNGVHLMPGFDSSWQCNYRKLFVYRIRFNYNTRYTYWRKFFNWSRDSCNKKRQKKSSCCWKSR